LSFIFSILDLVGKHVHVEKAGQLIFFYILAFLLIALYEKDLWALDSRPSLILQRDLDPFMNKITFVVTGSSVGHHQPFLLNESLARLRSDASG
jgi:hypothetical protein